MIIIDKPFIEEKEGVNTLYCEIHKSYGGNKRIYFTVNPPFDKYLVSEVCDAFLLACILPAMRHGEDIHVVGEVSERLYFNIIHSLVYIFSKSYGYKPINIEVSNTVATKFEGKGVGCGCSLGIDSLAAIFSHLETPDTPDYQITHLTYFNVGSHGYKNEEANHKTWLKDMVSVDRFASMVGLPVVKIESNIYELFQGFDFDQSGNIINMSTVLTMQKLFGKYLYGSNHPIEDFKLTNKAAGYFESVMLPIVSTESTDLIVANADMTRSQKTEIVASNTLSKNMLYVCWKELIVNNNPLHPIAAIKDNYLNCTRCEKCRRTLAHFEVMGKANEYSGIFDLKYWNKTKNDYLGKVLAFSSKDVYYQDIVNAAGRHGYHFSQKARIQQLLYQSHIKGLIHRIKQLVK